jgi:hypothetical protein
MIIMWTCVVFIYLFINLVPAMVFADNFCTLVYLHCPLDKTDITLIWNYVHVFNLKKTTTLFLGLQKRQIWYLF